MKLLSIFLLFASGSQSVAIEQNPSSSGPNIDLPCICCNDHLIHDLSYHQTANTIPCLEAFLPNHPSTVFVIGHVKDSVPNALAKRLTQHLFVSDYTSIQESKADWLVALNVLEKEKNPEVVLKKIREQLNPGGIAFILTGPKCPFLESVFEHRVPAVQEYKTLLAAEGFSLLHDIDFVSALWWQRRDDFLNDMKLWMGKNLSPNALKLADKLDFSWALFMGETHWLVVQKQRPSEL